MNIERLPSGSYRVSVWNDGKRYRKTFDHKPTQKEIMIVFSQEMRKDIEYKHSFQEAGDKYIDMKSNILSPKTHKEYTGMLRNIPEWFLKLDINAITQIEINKLVNEMTVTKSPKTVRNYHGLISAILGTFRSDLIIHTTLPQKLKNEPYIPSTKDIKRILAELKDTQYEIPIVLACYGMRRSEICAATPEDLDGNILHINKALVQNNKNEWVLKTTKTSDSTRDIVIPEYIAEKIKDQGYVYKGFPHSISKALNRVQKKLEIPKFSLHKLRHYFASKMSEMGVPEADILALGGWKTDNVMKTVYRHSMMDKEKSRKQELSKQLSNELFE